MLRTMTLSPAAPRPGTFCLPGLLPERLINAPMSFFEFGLSLIIIAAAGVYVKSKLSDWS